jgi:hypothetical protein
MIYQIEVRSTECRKAIESKSIGIGQLFRYLRALPSFTLLHAGRTGDGKRLERQYKLECPEVSCEFIETFAPHFLDPSFISK